MSDYLAPAKPDYTRGQASGGGTVHPFAPAQTAPDGPPCAIHTPIGTTVHATEGAAMTAARKYAAANPGQPVTVFRAVATVRASVVIAEEEIG